jgi:hypothetical protein
MSTQEYTIEHVDDEWQWAAPMHVVSCVSFPCMMSTHSIFMEEYSIITHCLEVMARPCKGGECEHVPTQATIDTESTKGSFMKKSCLKTYAVEEHDGSFGRGGATCSKPTR